MAQQTFKRSCPICEASCGLLIHADTDSREVIRVEGDPDDFRSQGFVCPKSQAIKGVFEDPERLRRPIRKTAKGDWEEIDWETALTTVTDKLLAVREQYGHEALGVYIGNPIGFDAGTMPYTSVFMRSLMTTHVFTAATMDHFPKLISSNLLYGRANILPIPDLDRCDYLLCLGGNPVVSQGSLMSAPNVKKRLQTIQQRDGKLIVLDPRRSETAELANEHIFIRPGTDAFFLFAMVNEIFAADLVDLGHLSSAVDGLEQLQELATEFTPEAVADVTGIDADTIRRITREFSKAQRACCYGRIGTCTVEFGTLASWLVDVVGILTGSFDSEGGMMFPRPATGELEPGPEAEFSYGRYHSAVRQFPEINGQLPCAVMAEEIDSAPSDKRIRSMITLAGNPVLSTPNGERLNRGLEGLEFMVSIDIYLNETTRHADLILPPLPQLETDNFDALAPGTAIHNYARYSEQVFEAESGGMPQWQILLEIAARLNNKSCDELEAELLAKQCQRLLSRSHSPAHGVTVDVALEKLQRESLGPSRQIDLMIRSGPYGDGFDDDAKGLTLAKLREKNTSVDLGALTPRLLEILRSPGGRIVLDHEYIVGDIPRLSGKLKQSNDAALLLIGRRQPQNMNTWLHNLPALAKGKARCTLQMHPLDAKGRALDDGSEVTVSSRVGEVCVPLELSENMMRGVVSLPHGYGHKVSNIRLSVAREKQPGVNANALTDDLVMDPLSGTGVTSGIPVEVS